MNLLSGGNPMTEQEIAALGPAFANYLGSFRGCFLQKRTAAHFDTYCRGLLSDLPRKSVEPIALEAGTAVRTLQEFLVTAQWDHERARTKLQRDLAAAVAALPEGGFGTIGVIDETSCQKWGDQTPGVQRQYLGCGGKVDNGIVTVHVGVTKGNFQALLDADLYLPKSWDADRDRCRAAGIPDEVRYQPKWRIALDQLVRLADNGLLFDWLVFDEGYGAAVPFLQILGLVNQKFVAEVPVNFAVRSRPGSKSQRADERLTVADARRGRPHRLAHRTVGDSVWRVRSATVWVANRSHTLIVAINETTAEVKYFLTNARGATLAQVLTVAFQRWTVEQTFRLAKQEAGLMHYEGRDYNGLLRHLIMALIVLGFVAEQTERLRGEKPGGNGRKGVSSAQPPLCSSFSAAAGHTGIAPHEPDPLLSPTPQRPGQEVPQKTAA
jgi:SRSO17 transposase